MSRFQDWDDIGLGLWVFVSPWVMGFSTSVPYAAWCAWTLGLALIVVGILAVSMPRLWEEPINIAIGLSLLSSPWLLSFSNNTMIITIFRVAGLLIVALAATAIAMDPRTQNWLDKHREHSTP